MLKRSRRGTQASTVRKPNPDSVASETSRPLPTCHGCLLHPPPLVDLARDLTISGFFLCRINASLFFDGMRPVWQLGGISTLWRHPRFPWDISRVPLRKALQSAHEIRLSARPRFCCISPLQPAAWRRTYGPIPGVTFRAPELHFLIPAIYGRYTCLP